MVVLGGPTGEVNFLLITVGCWSPSTPASGPGSDEAGSAVTNSH